MDGPSTPSDVQYVYVTHQRHTPNGLMAVPPPAPVPIIQPAPVRQSQLSRSNSAKTTHSPPSRSGSVKSDRDRQFKVHPPPRRTFRVINEMSPPPVYSDDLVRDGSPPPITLEDALRPRPQEKAESSQVSASRSETKTSPQASSLANGVLHDATAGPVEASTEEHEEQGEQDHDSDRSSSEHRRQRPTVLSILPPRISLRKDTLEDLSSWSASLFSSLPSALRDSPGSSGSTAATSASTTQSTKSSSSKHRTKPSVTLPTIVLHPEVREEDENEDEVEDEDEIIEHDYSHTASPLYHELMGMMQGRAAAANGVGVGSPASPGFQRETASESSRAAASRDSQLTIRFNPRRDSSRDSSASTSTLTHATIVRGASIVRRVRADVVTTPPAFSRHKGKERGLEEAPVEIVQVVQENGDIDDDSSSDASSSDEDGASESPVDTLAFTSGPNSQEDAGRCRSPRSPRLMHGRGEPLPSPLPSPLRSSFTEPVCEEPAQVPVLEELQKAPMQGPYVTPPPTAPPVSVRWPPLTVSPIIAEGPEGILPPLLSSSEATEQTEQVEKGIVPPRFTCTGAALPRYPAWLAAVVLPLAEFIDDSADPRALFADLQEIAQGESGSVYAARAVPAVALQFRPPAPLSPVPGSASPSSSPSLSAPAEEEEEGVAQQTHELVAIKRVRLLRGGTEKLLDLRRELELARALRHANVLRMERLYVDVVEESLWIGMELMDRSLADVLAVVGEDAGSSSDWADLEVQVEEEGGGGTGSGDMVRAGLVEISEQMVARFVGDVSATNFLLFEFC